MPDKKKKEEAINFQVVHIEFYNPITGKTKIYSFIGPAMFQPEHSKEIKEAPLEEVLKDLAIDEPYNPFEDETNSQAQKWLVDQLRDRLNKEEDE